MLLKMAYRPDPGQIFESDVHRRVLASLPAEDATPLEFRYAIEAAFTDENIPVYVRDQAGYDELGRVVESLIDDGFAVQTDGALQRTAAGTEALAAPEPHPPADLTPEKIAEREAANEQKAQDDAVRAATDRLAANQKAVEEINAQIADDEALIAEASA